MVQNRPSAKSQPLRISAANILETGKHRRGDGSILSVSSSPRGVPEPDLFPAYLRIRSIDGSETKQSLPGPRASTWGLPTELGAGETIARFQLCYGDIQESRNLESRGVSIPHRIAPAKNRERKLAVLRGEWFPLEPTASRLGIRPPSPMQTATPRWNQTPREVAPDSPIQNGRSVPTASQTQAVPSEQLCVS